jgi:imidazolonepropionase-like amidohydrolase
MIALSRRRALQALAGGAAALAMPALLAEAQQKSVALVGATLLRGVEPPLAKSVIVIEGGRFTYVGDDEGRVGGAERIDVAGKTLTGGLIDLLTRIGAVEVDLEPQTRDDAEQPREAEDPVRAAFRTADGYNPASSVVKVARIEGLTSVGVVPVEGLVTGQSCWVDLDGALPDEAIARANLALHVAFDDPWHSEYEKSRGTVMLRLRELFDDARAYRQNRAAYDRRQLRELDQSRLDLEAVVQALEGTLPVVFHVDRASDIVAVMALAKEQGVRAVIASAAEGWKVAARMAEARVPAIVYPLDHGPRSFAALGAREDNAALMHAAGVTLALSTGESHNARKLRQVAGNAVRAGLPHGAAIDALTDTPARIMGMNQSYGIPKSGRIANVVVWSGDPLELSTHAEKVFIRGRAVDLRSRQTALFERYR